MIRRIDQAIGSSCLIGNPEIGLIAVREMLYLFDEEGTCDASIPRTYYDAFQIAIAHGDERRAKVFAERAYTTRVITEGDDSPETAKLRRFAERPAKHRSYRMFMDSSSASNSDSHIDFEVLESWLWMQDDNSSRGRDRKRLLRRLRRSN